ncbi:MAG: hypothetical protein NC341_02585 [Blautia sp.]|nr:hypothetical protein [Blautia sp.]MCM1200504.1 hypothetical protein [Bacteroides fragilis]
MKTVVERKVGLGSRYPFAEKKPLLADDFRQERSCFYDFGAKNPVEFSGFVRKGDSAFIDEIGKGFDS